MQEFLGSRVAPVFEYAVARYRRHEHSIPLFAHLDGGHGRDVHGHESGIVVLVGFVEIVFVLEPARACREHRHGHPLEGHHVDERSAVAVLETVHLVVVTRLPDFLVACAGVGGIGEVGGTLQDNLGPVALGEQRK